MANNELTCPYCGAEQLTHEPDEISADMCLTECEKCYKAFWYSVSVTHTYDSRKDDEADFNISPFGHDMTCRVCGCTDDHACPGGCYWVEDNLCSQCAEALKIEEDILCHASQS